jgi:hypothetical protein
MAHPCVQGFYYTNRTEQLLIWINSPVLLGEPGGLRNATIGGGWRLWVGGDLREQLDQFGTPEWLFQEMEPFVAVEFGDSLSQS